MGKGKGKNKGKGRGRKKSHSLRENNLATKVESQPVGKPVGKPDGKHHCLRKRPTHAPAPRCIRLGHMVECPFHTDSYSRPLSECVKCISADRRLVQQERKEKGR
ncbi:hypothetical protein VN97_g6460 [Penicillium thymicola]|uniref:Uncharacterized protein n=1 Tax=Penicillium thymicola TaxID=293382 RepID=A0AAI9X7L5_PENTH|nr:hypothetical protein VN97_g6460 [Penicillium thymicola]